MLRVASRDRTALIAHALDRTYELATRTHPSCHRASVSPVARRSLFANLYFTRRRSFLAGSFDSIFSKPRPPPPPPPQLITTTHVLLLSIHARVHAHVLRRSDRRAGGRIGRLEELCHAQADVIVCVFLPGSDAPVPRKPRRLRRRRRQAAAGGPGSCGPPHAAGGGGGSNAHHHHYHHHHNSCSRMPGRRRWRGRRRRRPFEGRGGIEEHKAKRTKKRRRRRLGDSEQPVRGGGVSGHGYGVPGGSVHREPGQRGVVSSRYSVRKGGSAQDRAFASTCARFLQHMWCMWRTYVHGSLCFRFSLFSCGWNRGGCFCRKFVSAPARASKQDRDREEEARGASGAHE